MDGNLDAVPERGRMPRNASTQNDYASDEASSTVNERRDSRMYGADQHLMWLPSRRSLAEASVASAGHDERAPRAAGSWTARAETLQD